MIKLSSEAKDRLSVVINVGKTIFHWGFVPTVLYLGTTANRSSVTSLLLQIMTSLDAKPQRTAANRRAREQHSGREAIGFKKGSDAGMPPITPLREDANYSALREAKLRKRDAHHRKMRLGGRYLSANSAVSPLRAAPHTVRLPISPVMAVNSGVRGQEQDLW